MNLEMNTSYFDMENNWVEIIPVNNSDNINGNSGSNISLQLSVPNYGQEKKGTCKRRANIKSVNYKEPSLKDFLADRVTKP